MKLKFSSYYISRFITHLNEGDARDIRYYFSFNEELAAMMTQLSQITCGL